MDDAIAQDLLDQYNETQCTLWLTPPMASGEAKWVDSQLHPSLQQAVDAIVADGGKHAFFDIQIHTPGADRPVTSNELLALTNLRRRAARARTATDHHS